MPQSRSIRVIRIMSFWLGNSAHVNFQVVIMTGKLLSSDISDWHAPENQQIITNHCMRMKDVIVVELKFNGVVLSMHSILLLTQHSVIIQPSWWCGCLQVVNTGNFPISTIHPMWHEHGISTHPDKVGVVDGAAAKGFDLQCISENWQFINPHLYMNMIGCY